MSARAKSVSMRAPKALAHVARSATLDTKTPARESAPGCGRYAAALMGSLSAGVSPIETTRRLDTMTAVAMMANATTAMITRTAVEASLPMLNFTIAGAMSTDT